MQYSITWDKFAARQEATVHQEMVQMEQSADGRVEQLEKLVRTLRHDLRGSLTPALLIADRLKMNSDPAIQRSGIVIATAVERILFRLSATYDLVPPLA
jgi:hypothetical protein